MIQPLIYKLIRLSTFLIGSHFFCSIHTLSTTIIANNRTNKYENGATVAASMLYTIYPINVNRIYAFSQGKFFLLSNGKFSFANK